MEMLGFFIILGVLVVVVLRHQIWPTPEGGRGKAEEVEEASRRMKREMEQSADEIIARMGAHIDRLEHLVEEADARAKALEEQIEALRHPALPLRLKARDDDFDDLLAASLAVENEVGEMPPLSRPRAFALSDTSGARDGVSHRTGEVNGGAGGEEEIAEDRVMEAPYHDRALLTVEAWEDGAPLAEEPEIVVSASVADVADLPMTPEEEAWAAEEEGLPERPEEGDSVPPIFQETALGEGAATLSLPPEDAYADGNEAIFAEKSRVVQGEAYETFLSDGDEPLATEPSSAALYAVVEGEETAAVSIPEGAPSDVSADIASAYNDIEASGLFDDIEAGGLSLGSAQAEAFFDTPTREEGPGEISASAEESMQGGAGTGEEPADSRDAADAEDDILALSAQEAGEELPSQTPTFPSVPSADGDSTAQKIRERLAQGHATADIAREFHIGIGAVELVSQMDKNKMGG